jgi:hypothetical protein
VSPIRLTTGGSWGPQREESHSGSEHVQGYREVCGVMRLLTRRRCRKVKMLLRFSKETKMLGLRRGRFWCDREAQMHRVMLHTTRDRGA